MKLFRPLIVLASLLAPLACGHRNSHIALGTLERERLVLTATANEVISQLHVVEGQKVAAGTPLVQLQPARQQARLALAQANLSKAQASLLELKNGSRPEEIAALQARAAGMQANLTETLKQLQRMTQLLSQNVVKQADFDYALSQNEAAAAAFEEVQKQLQLLMLGPRSELIAQAQAQVDAASAAANLELQALQDLTLQAPKDARVEAIPWHLGERVTVGATVAVLQTSAVPYARIYVPQQYRAQLRIGDRLPVYLEGYEQAFEGKIRLIHSEPAYTPFYALNQKERAHLVFLTEVDLDSGTLDIPSGLSVEVHLP